MEYTNFAQLNETYSGPNERRPSALLTFGGRAGYSDDESDEWDPSPDTMEDFMRVFARDNSEGDDISSDSDKTGGDESESDSDSDTDAPKKITEIESDIVADISEDEEIVADIEPDIEPVDELENAAVKGGGEFDNINLLLEKYAIKLKNK